MAKYLLAYKGGGGMADTEEQRQAIMAQWGQWFGSLGPALVDGGNPIGASSAVEADGSVGAATSGLSGYSILSADSLAAAVEMAKGCPVISGGGTVEVYETFEAM